MTGLDDPVATVRAGYEALSYRYRADDAEAGQYAPWLAELATILKPGSRILDLGCGCGVPVARDLAAAGYRVAGSISATCRSSGLAASSRTPASSGPMPLSWSCRRGLPVVGEEFVPEGEGGHSLFWGRR